MPGKACVRYGRERARQHWNLGRASLRAHDTPTKGSIMTNETPETPALVTVVDDKGVPDAVIDIDVIQKLPPGSCTTWPPKATTSKP